MIKRFFFCEVFDSLIVLLISEVEKKKKRENFPFKGERAGKVLRGGGEDFGQGGGIVGGVADELRRRRRSINFRCHGSPAERTYVADLRRGSWRKRKRMP